MYVTLNLCFRRFLFFYHSHPARPTCKRPCLINILIEQFPTGDSDWKTDFFNLFVFAKGQLISKWFLVSSNSSKKRMNEFFLLLQRHVFVRFLEEIEDTKNHFEIIWPLPIMQNLHDFLFSVSANIWLVLKNVWNVYLFLIIYLLICNTITSLPFSPRPFEVDFGGLPSEDSIIICRPPCNGRLSGLYRVAKFRLWLPATTAAAQCVELELGWQFCVHSSTCPEIYF